VLKVGGWQKAMKQQKLVASQVKSEHYETYEFKSATKEASAQSFVD